MPIVEAAIKADLLGQLTAAQADGPMDLDALAGILASVLVTALHSATVTGTATCSTGGGPVTGGLS